MLTSSDTATQKYLAPHIEGWKWRVLSLAAAAIFIVVLDFSVVNVAMPSIQAQLRFTATNLQWVGSAYALVLGGFMLLGGRCADLFGKRQVLLAGVAIFTLTSLGAGLSGLSHVYGQVLLIACRAIQGLGGALIGPAALSVVNTTFAEGPERNRAMGVFGSIATAGFACGTLLGGILTGHFGWPSIFFVNVPLGILLLIAAPFLVPKAGDSSTTRFDLKTLDIGGAITVTLSLVLFIYTCIAAEKSGWASIETWLTFGLAIVLMLAFIGIEARIASPLVPLAIFKRRTLVAANLVMLLLEGVNAATFWFLSLYMQQVLGYSPQQTGLAFLPIALWMIIASNVAPRVVSRFGIRPVLIGGTALLVLSPLLLMRLSVESLYLRDILPVLLLIGTGIAGAITAGFIAATMGVPDEDQGLASGLIQTSQQAGAALGLAILVSVAASRSATSQVTGATPHVAQVAGYHAAFLVAGLLSGLALLTAIFGIKAEPKAIMDGTPESPVAESGTAVRTACETTG